MPHILTQESKVGSVRTGIPALEPTRANVTRDLLLYVGANVILLGDHVQSFFRFSFGGFVAATSYKLN
jgi:hypothetical protein